MDQGDGERQDEFKLEGEREGQAEPGPPPEHEGPAGDDIVEPEVVETAPGDLEHESEYRHEQALAVGCHLLGILTSFIGPLILWLMKRKESALVDDQGKQALNWQLAIFCLYLLVWPLRLIVAVWPNPIVSFCMRAPGRAIWAVGAMVAVLAAAKVHRGIWFHYPLPVRFFD